MDLALGLVLPPVIDVLNREVINEDERFIVACLTCLIIALIIDWPQIANGNASNLPATAALLFTEAQSVFKLYWSKSFLRDQLQTKVGKVEDPTKPQLG